MCRWWDDDLTPMLLVGDSAELWLRAGWRVRATVHGAVNGSTQLVLEVSYSTTWTTTETALSRFACLSH